MATELKLSDALRVIESRHGVDMTEMKLGEYGDWLRPHKHTVLALCHASRRDVQRIYRVLADRDGIVFDGLRGDDFYYFMDSYRAEVDGFVLEAASLMKEVDDED